MKGEYKGNIYERWLPDSGIFLCRITEKESTKTHEWIKSNVAQNELPPYEKAYLRGKFEEQLGTGFTKLVLNYQTFWWIFYGDSSGNCYSEPLSCVDFYFDNSMKDYEVVNLDREHNIFDFPISIK